MPVPFTPTVAVISYDPVFALDLELALRQSGCESLLLHDRLTTQAERSALRGCAAVVIDVKGSAEFSACLLRLVAQEAAPLVVVASHDVATVRRVATVVACFSKPVMADEVAQVVRKVAIPGTPSTPSSDVVVP